MRSPFSSWSLSRKILCLALLNLLLLAGVILVFARSQFNFGAESLLIGPAEERIKSIGNEFLLDLENAGESGRDDLLKQYGKQYDAEFLLLRPRGGIIAGPSIEIPQPVLDRLRRDGRSPGKRGDRRPPPEDGPGDREPPPSREGRELPDGPPPDGPPRDRPPHDGPPRDGPPPDGPPPDRRPDGPGPPGARPPREPVFVVIAGNPSQYWVGVRIPIRVSGSRRPFPGVLLIRASSMFNTKLFFDWRLWLLLALSAAGVSLVCWLPFIRGLTSSITQMNRVTNQIAQGRFDVRAPDARGDELGHLGTEINRMSARLERFVKNQKRFLGDIAHELCGPIARIQFALAILEQRAEEAQMPHVAVLRDEIQEMSGLVNELLSFSKAGLESGAAELVPVNVRDVVERAVARESVAAADIKVELDGQLTAVAHEGYLVRAIANLVRNAIRYAGESGPITVSAGRSGSSVEIRVADSGPGLPEASLEQVFEPFYRPESDRRRETGGTGLGLAIVKSCVEACKGKVFARNHQPSGLEVIITLNVLSSDGR